MNNAYEVYLNKIMLPVAPGKISTKIDGQNKTINLINDTEINILKAPKLTTVSFECLLPNSIYPFAVYKNGFLKASYYLSAFEKLKISKKPFQFIVIRDKLHSTNLKMSLEDYTIEENAGDGTDIKVSIKLKQYKSYQGKSIEVKADSGRIEVSEKREAPAKKGDNHKVVKGDCMWMIAQKYYGDGNRCKEIYEANKKNIDERNKGTGNPKYTIYPGQTFIIP